MINNVLGSFDSALEFMNSLKKDASSFISIVRSSSLTVHSDNDILVYKYSNHPEQVNWNPMSKNF